MLVQSLETAIVRSIEVREGQKVRAGDVLARLDSTFAAADLGALGAQVSSLEAEVARLQAESQGQPFAYVGPDRDRALQAALSAHRKAEYDSRIENFGQRYEALASVRVRAATGRQAGVPRPRGR